MARVYDQDFIASHPGGPPGTLGHHLYNGMDNMVTREVFDALEPRLDETTRRTYNFSLACQSPALAMSLRGCAVDENERIRAAKRQEAEEVRATARLCELVAPHWGETIRRAGKCKDGKLHKWPKGLADDISECAVCGASRLIAKSINPHSPIQIMKLMYERLRLPKQKNHKTHKVSVDDECLGKLKEKFPNVCAEIVDAILDARGARKQVSVLNAKRDPDLRWRASFSVGATESGRWSSSKSAYWTASSMQTIADRSRSIFVPDPGMIMFYADLEQAESRVVAYDAEDDNYIAAHLRGDVHTDVAKLVWPQLEWVGNQDGGLCDFPWHEGKAPHKVCDRCVADMPTAWDAHHEYRWYSKHVQHGSNIGMTEHGIARDARITVKQAKDVQARYFGAFARVRSHQLELIRELKETGQLTSPLGRRRVFFGRVWDASTQRECLAQTQQSTIGDLLNIALWRIWKELDLKLTVRRAPHPNDPNSVWCIANIHDAVLGQVRAGDNVSLVRVKELMIIPMQIRGRECVVPVEIQIGPNWGHDSLSKWKGE